MKHTKEIWAVGFSDQGLGHGTYGVMVKDTSEVVIKDLTKDKAEEIVRRWNAFEEGGLVNELRTACEDALKKLNWPIYTEQEKYSMRHCKEKLEAALAKS